MATQNSFDLLDNDTEDPSLLIAAVEQQKLEKPQKAPASTPAQAQPVKSAKLPSKPLPPAQAVKRPRLGQVVVVAVVVDEVAMGSIVIREVVITPMDFQEGTGPMKREKEGGSMKGAAMLGLEVLSVEVAVGVLTMEKLEKGNTLAGSPQWDWTNEFKRDGAGRGNWETEENASENDKKSTEKGEEDAADAKKENAANEVEEKEPENKEMTLEEYEKILEEKRKAFLALKTEGRKVDGKEFESMQQLSNKKSNGDIFIELGSEKDKHKDADTEEEIKAISINGFLKPAEGKRYYGGGRGEEADTEATQPPMCQPPRSKILDTSPLWVASDDGHCCLLV